MRNPESRHQSATSRPGPAIDGLSIERLILVGLERAELDALDLRESAVEVPDGWRERGNRIYSPAGVGVHAGVVLSNPGLAGASGVLLILASPIDGLAVLGCHGDRATIFIGPDCHLPQAQIHCGANSAIVLRSLVTCTFAGHVDARNGGMVFADADQLWANNVYLATDDMHALRDSDTGARVNRRGGVIRLGRHIWLGREAVVMGGATIEGDSIVALRAVVRAGGYPHGAVLAGLPARVVRVGATWSRDDDDS